ncbi:MAG: OmpA family protein [Desulfobacterales bacterium]|nr:OmpA family protein [Desulfobacterales bacterium]
MKNQKKHIHYIGYLLHISSVVVMLLLTHQSVKAEEMKPIIAMEEKNMIESAMSEYQRRIDSIEQQLVNLKSEREWLTIKIFRIQTQSRTVPTELRTSQTKILKKMAAIEKEREQLNTLIQEHQKRLQQINEKIDSYFPDSSFLHNPLDKRIVVEEDLKDKDTKKTTHGMSKDTNATDALKQPLMTSIQEKDLTDWVELLGSGSEFRLEVRLPVLFGSGKTSLTKDYKMFFAKLATVLLPYKNQVRVVVAGFSDSSKSKTGPSNWEIAHRRAESVLKELVQKGLPSAAFTIMSYGEYTPQSLGDDKKASELSRRAEISVYFNKDQGVL